MDFEVTARTAEASQALADLVYTYQDVFGPKHWCDDTDLCDGEPCPATPGMVTLSNWVFVAEWADPDPFGDFITRVHTSPGAANAALGMVTRIAREM